MTDTPSFRRHAAVPKPHVTSKFVPALPEWQLGHLLQRLTPAERRAMREICEHADLLHIDQQVFILARVSPATVDALAAFEADEAERESDLDDEPMSDDESTHDQENDLIESENDAPEMRRRFADQLDRRNCENWSYAHGWRLRRRVDGIKWQKRMAKRGATRKT